VGRQANNRGVSHPNSCAGDVAAGSSLLTLDWPLPNLPTLFSDETLYSWAGFAYARNGVADVREFSRRLYGSPYTALLHDFPANLNELDANLHGSLGPPRTLALRHTLLGYFLPAHLSESAEAILRRTLTGAYSDLKFKLGIPASRVGGYHPLKACSVCMEADERDRGRAYWHVEHQLPSVLVCAKHLVPLRWVNDDSATPVHRRGWILPRMGLDREWVELPKVSQTQLERLAHLAALSSAWAGLEPGSLDGRQLARTYQSAFRARGWVTSGGSLRLATLVSAVRSHFEGLESLPGLAPLASIRADWPGLVGSLARNSPRSGHPLKHLLLISMLFDDWGAFTREYTQHVEAAGQPETETLAAIDENRAVIDEFRRLVQQDGFSITAASKQVGISVTTGVRWAKLLGIQFTSRSKHITYALLESIRSLLRDGKDKDEICQACGISQVSLNRLISSEPTVAEQWRKARHDQARVENRGRFAKAVADHRGWTLKQIRALPGNGYMWLYRNDRDWLLEHLPGLWGTTSID
jgi:hypothetical protein